MDRFPAEQSRAIKELQQDVERLKVLAKTVKPIPIEVPHVSNVSNPPNFESPSQQTGEFASGSAYTALRLDCARLHDTLRDLMNAMRSAGLMG